MSARVALSGSAGTGKTTLGRRLAAELGVPFIEEGMRARLEAGLDLHDLSPTSWRRLSREMWDEQLAREEAAGPGFVADRSSLDYAAFWLHYGLYEDARETEDFVDQMARAARRYERILLLPWGVLELRADGVRSTNPWLQLRFQTIVEGLLERFAPPGRVLRVPRTRSLDERLTAARTALNGA